MAIDFITVNRNDASAIYAADLLSYVATLREAWEQGSRIIAIMNHLNDGVIFTNIESKFGLPANTGQTVFDMVNGAVGSMNGLFQVSDAKNLTERVG